MPMLNTHYSRMQPELSLEKMREANIKIVHSLNIENVKDPFDQDFILELIKYLKTRLKNSPASYHKEEEIGVRVRYCRDLILSIKSGDFNQIDSMLQEDRIVEFKGFISKILYNCLKDYRDNKNEEINLETIACIK